MTSTNFIAVCQWEIQSKDSVIPGTAESQLKGTDKSDAELTIEEMKTGESVISLIRYKTYLACRASEQDAAISVTDKLEVFVAKIQSGLTISPYFTFRRVKQAVLCFVIQKLEQVTFHFQTLNNSFNY